MNIVPNESGESPSAPERPRRLAAAFARAGRGIGRAGIPDCFIGGTLVHTREGLRPIEKIRVGDYVLSKPEDGTGEPGYKRVTQTFRSEDKEVWYVDFVSKPVYEEAMRRGKTYDTSYRLVVTPNHPFWVKGLGWTRADELIHTVSQLDFKLPEFELANGDITVLSDAGPIKKREGNSDHGWCLIQDGNGGGFTIDLSEGGRSAEFCGYIPNSRGKFTDENYPMDWSLPENAYRCTVYNLEVEDDHTCFAGTKGVWVRSGDPVGRSG
jgi:intein/homing endonuclease